MGSIHIGIHGIHCEQILHRLNCGKIFIGLHCGEVLYRPSLVSSGASSRGSLSLRGSLAVAGCAQWNDRATSRSMREGSSRHYCMVVGKKKVDSTRTSPVVTHPSTTRA